jgi:hypothetical protein
MNLTTEELRLVIQLLCEYRVNMLKAARMPPPKSGLTEEGRARYEADAKLAGQALTKILDTREVA